MRIICPNCNAEYQINFDQSKTTESVFYEIKNIQQLNNVVSKEFKKVSLE